MPQWLWFILGCAIVFLTPLIIYAIVMDVISDCSKGKEKKMKKEEPEMVEYDVFAKFRDDLYRQIKYARSDASELYDNFKNHINKPSFPTASEARVLALHGKDSKDWQDYKREMEIIEREINKSISAGFKFIDVDFFVCSLTDDKLVGMGYKVENKSTELQTITRISW
jgi:hypothetical protein